MLALVRPAETPRRTVVRVGDVRRLPAPQTVDVDVEVSGVICADSGRDDQIAVIRELRQVRCFAFRDLTRSKPSCDLVMRILFVEPDRPDDRRWTHQIPQRFAAISDPRTFVSTPELLAEFLAANPGMKSDGIAVQCGGPGPRLQEIRICFDKGGNFRSCGRNENQAKMCNAPRVYYRRCATAAILPRQPVAKRFNCQRFS